MIQSELPVPLPASALAEELVQLQLRVARRADVLARQRRGEDRRDRRLWLKAEYEIFEQAERAHPTRLLRERSLIPAETAGV